LALGLGSGLLPKMPGTWGTLAALPIYFLLASLPNYAYLMAVALAFIAGIAICGRTAQELGHDDHGAIVWDEFVGLWVALAFLPLEWLWILAGFVLFRLFDMLKPWPISWADRRIKGGVGIMLDDLLAGIATFICLFIARYLWA
jgi:phosphatidylglycerophosphatase A